MRTRVYVDGFNLYYGKLKGSSYKWLDPMAMCRLMLPKNDIQYLRYFTARVRSHPKDPQQSLRQQIYLRALATLPDCHIHYGNFRTHEVKMPDAQAWRAGSYSPRLVVKTEEKGSDVNLATWLLVDGFENLFDCAVIVSNDSDLVEPLRLMKQKFSKKIVVLNTRTLGGSALFQSADYVIKIRNSHLERSQFASVLSDKNGTLHKPDRW